MNNVRELERNQEFRDFLWSRIAAGVISIGVLLTLVWSLL